MGTQTGEAQKKTTPLPVSIGLVFELEKLAIPGQRFLFAACQKALKDKQVSLTPALWSRFGLANSLTQGLGRLLATTDKQSLSADKLARTIQDIFLREITQPAVKLNAALHALFSEAVKLNFKIGTLSLLPDEQAQALLAHLDLRETAPVCAMQKNNGHAPTPDCWLMTCKAIGIPPRHCVAVVESAVACNAALEAGLRCVVVPDEFTSYQDFGGADLVVEDMKDLHAKDLRALLHACAFR